MELPTVEIPRLRVYTIGGLFPERGLRFTTTPRMDPADPEKQSAPRGLRILVVEDDPAYQDFLRSCLSRQRHSVLILSGPKDVVPKCMAFLPELAFLDLNLPGKNGFEILKMIRAAKPENDLPCVMMTAMEDNGGLLSTASKGLGGTDFIQKPFTYDDLVEVIGSAVRCRGPETEREAWLERAALKLDSTFRRVWYAGKLLGVLPPKRFQLLWCLVGADGPLTREALLDRVWPESRDPNTLAKNIQRLRRDLGPGGARLIETLPGGYAFRV